MSRQKFCSLGCRSPRKNSEFINSCVICGKQFQATFDKQKCCSKDCRQKSVALSRKIERIFTCSTCGIQFSSKKKVVKYCSHICFTNRFGNVRKICEACNSEFIVPYRFRKQKTCNATCAGKLTSKRLKTRITKMCLCCGTTYEIVRSYEQYSKYCSSKCFYKHRYNRESKFLIKECETCGKEFKTLFIRRLTKHCSRSCAVSGEKNPRFGKPGTMRNRPSWTRGLTAETDDRIKRLGVKISNKLKNQFRSGERTHKGINNPNYGNTSDTLSIEKRRNFSLAAIDRILKGVSGYKTGHLTGTYVCKKCVNSVRFKSSWELIAMMWWDDNPDIISYEYEPDIIKLDENRRAIPDFKVTPKFGKQYFIEIKPTAIQELESVKEKLQLVKQKLNSMGYEYVLFGDVEIEKCKTDLGGKLQDEINSYKNRC